MIQKEGINPGLCYKKYVMLLSIFQYVAICNVKLQVSLHIVQITAQLYSSWLTLSPWKVEGDTNPQSTAGSSWWSLTARECKWQKKKTNIFLHLGFLKWFNVFVSYEKQFKTSADWRPLCMKQRPLNRQISVAYLDKDVGISTKTSVDLAVSVGSQVTFYW